MEEFQVLDQKYTQQHTSYRLCAQRTKIKWQKEIYDAIPVMKPEDVCSHGDFTPRHSSKEMKTCVYIKCYRKTFTAALFIVFQN